MLADFLGLSGKGQLILGVVAVVGALLLSPSIRSTLFSLLGKVLTPSPSPKPSPNPSPSPDSPPSLAINSNLEVHEAVSNLIAYFISQKDEKGVMLSGAVGQHVYAKGIDLAAKSVTSLGIEGSVH